MRNLREKLNAIAGSPKRTSNSVSPTGSVYCEEHRVPLTDLNGIAESTIEEIQACDPAFRGTDWQIERLLFLDTETTGLSGGAGTYAFEIGAGVIENGFLCVKQYVMLDYPQEKQMLSAIVEAMKTHDTIVTFNGKSFDIPLLESRMTMCGIRTQITCLPHLDLLHVCRRIYKLRLQKCNLQTLERVILGQQRNDDLPGSEAPARYMAYQKTGEFGLVKDVLRHNLDDVVSLAKLTGHVAAVFRSPLSLTEAKDIYSVGKVLEKGGHMEAARRCYRILSFSSMGSAARFRLAKGYKKEKDWKETLSLCRRMIEDGQNGVWPYIELAKYYEHVEKNYDEALSCAAKGLNYLLNRLSSGGNDYETETEQIRRRIERLLQKKESRGLNEPWRKLDRAEGPG